MKLQFVALDKLSVAKSNMRFTKRPPDVADLLPTVRKRGILQPVIVRPNCADGHFVIVAGARRFTAALVVAEERRTAGEEPDLLPCAILDASDDAAAIEASMIENMARRDADEVTQWASFTRLVKAGQTVGDIAATFGLPDLAVKRILALGNLLPRIRTLYAKDEIDAATVRYLTLASKSQQRDWLALLDDPEGYPPTGQRLKAWLFGGQSIPLRHALFDVPASGLATVADLFGEDGYFADADAFWAAQNAAIAGMCEGFRDVGWADAVVVPPDQHFVTWDHQKTPKRKGGKVFIDVRASGEVAFHEGYLSRAEATRRAKAEDGGESGTSAVKPTRPELSGPLQTYLDLHRHAAVRADLLAQPQTALRLLVAHAIAGSMLWSVRVEPQTSRNADVTASIAESSAEAAFDTQRRAVLAMLDMDEDEATVTGGVVVGARGFRGEGALVALFRRLLDLPDRAVLDVLAVVMGETLASGGAAVEALGLQLGTDMAAHWHADPVFFALVRDREVANWLLAEVAGETVATANAAAPAKAKKAIVADCLAGTNGRTQMTGWVPKWLAFPPAAYTQRGGVGMVGASEQARAALVADEPEAETHGGAVPPTEPDPDGATDADGNDAAGPVALAA